MIVLHILALTLSVAASPAELQEESRYYTVDYLTPPEGEVLEVGGLGQLSDGRLVVSTRRGEVWLVSNPLAEDPAEATFQLFASGLWEGLGLNVVDDQIYIVQRGEVSRLLDLDGDDVCDRVETFSDDWGISGNYHEFVYGLPQDAEGNFYISLNVAFFSPEWWHGQSTVPWRGWVLKITPEGDVVPFAFGFRSPCGISIDAQGRLLVTDNQGDWMGASPVFHVQEGGFYGHPASLRWTEEYLEAGAEPSDRVPPARASIDRKSAAVWLPYKWSRSPGNTATDTTAGLFGPFAGQNILAELTNGMLLRLMLEEVEGQTQGAVAILRQGVGSAVRLHFAEDGTLFSGLTNRGWGGRAPAFGIARLRWTGETPLEVRDIHIQSDGFALEFTLPLAEGFALEPSNVTITQYDYDYWWEYGSPQRDLRAVDVLSAELSDDRLSLRVRTAMEGESPLVAGRVARIQLAGLVTEDGRALLHDELAYTVNQIPGSPRTSLQLASDQVTKVVAPPPGRDADNEDWLRLTYGDATSLWNAEGWELVDAALDADDPRRLSTSPGVAALTNTASETPSDYVSQLTFGDAEVHLDFMLPKEGSTGLFLMGRYEVRLADLDGIAARTPEHTGGIPASANFPGSKPEANAYRGPGTWHELDVAYRAPRFGPQGNKLSNARITSVRIDGVVVQEDVELPEASTGAPFTEEAATGPLVIVGTRTHVALGNVQVKLLDQGELEAQTEFKTLIDFDEESLQGWTQAGTAIWSFEDEVLVGEGPMGHIYSPQIDFHNVEVLAQIKISDGGNSGLYLRARAPAGNPNGWPDGYEIQINASFADPQKTGSIYNLSPITTHLISPDTWCDLRVSCQDEEEGTRLRVWLNGILVNDFLDPLADGKHRWGAGSIALQQHHESSVLEVRSLSIRRL